MCLENWTSAWRTLKLDPSNNINSKWIKYHFFYISISFTCTGEFCFDIYIFTHNVFQFYSYLHHYPSSSSSLLRTMSTVSLLYFHTRIQSTSTIFTLLLSLYLPSYFPLVTTHGQDLCYLAVLHFLNCIVLVQGFFALVFHICINIL
jgi:hypothetical protein